MFSLYKKRHNKYLEKLKKISYEINIMETIISLKDELSIKERIKTLKNIIPKEIREDNKNNFGGFENDLLVESITLLREVSKRVLGERPFDEQIWAGLALFEGFIIEMRNGEGKTLAATIPIFLEYLKGKNTHLVTANEYLAMRDANWMGAIYHELGLSVGVLQEDSVLFSDNESKHFNLIEDGLSKKRKVYNCDVVYGKGSRYATDYLMDNMCKREESICQIKDLNFVLIDEIDSILIDEARTPVTVTESDHSMIKAISMAKKIAVLLNKNEDYIVNKEYFRIEISDEGIKKIERYLDLTNIYDLKLLENKKYIGILPAIDNALKAKELIKYKHDYFIEANKVVPIDENSGRPQYGRTYSGGLHQAIEEKHGIETHTLTKELAKISLQKYFQKYKKIAGMTGTAVFNIKEYKSVYGKDVITIPSRFKIVREDKNDIIYRTKNERLDRVISEIENAYIKKQPVLINTLSVEEADEISNILVKKAVKHELLHAIKHQREAEIIKKAGQTSAITVAAKMAGRGTDIKLARGVEELGGLFVIGVERNESRRIDEQLRGRAGRHGEIGSTQFFLSLEDELMMEFGSDRISSVMTKLGMEEGVPIEHSIITKSIENAQKRITERNSILRKQLYEFDEVLDKHRSNFYSLRKNILKASRLFDEVSTIFDNKIYRILKQISNNNTLKREQVSEFLSKITAIVNGDISNPFEGYGRISRLKLIKWAKRIFASHYTAKEIRFTKVLWKEIIKFSLLKFLDEFWEKHLKNLYYLNSKMSMEICTQSDILVWYRLQSNILFDGLIVKVEDNFLKFVFQVELKSRDNSTREEYLEK